MHKLVSFLIFVLSIFQCHYALAFTSKNHPIIVPEPKISIFEQHESGTNLDQFDFKNGEFKRNTGNTAQTGAKNNRKDRLDNASKQLSNNIVKALSEIENNMGSNFEKEFLRNLKENHENFVKQLESGNLKTEEANPAETIKISRVQKPLAINLSNKIYEVFNQIHENQKKYRELEKDHNKDIQAILETGIISEIMNKELAAYRKINDKSKQIEVLQNIKDRLHLDAFPDSLSKTGNLERLKTWFLKLEPINNLRNYLAPSNEAELITLINKIEKAKSSMKQLEKLAKENESKNQSLASELAQAIVKLRETDLNDKFVTALLSNLRKDTYSQIMPLQPNRNLVRASSQGDDLNKTQKKILQPPQPNENLKKASFEEEDPDKTKRIRVVSRQPIKSPNDSLSFDRRDLNQAFLEKEDPNKTKNIDRSSGIVCKDKTSPFYSSLSEIGSILGLLSPKDKQTQTQYTNIKSQHQEPSPSLSPPLVQKETVKSPNKFKEQAVNRMIPATPQNLPEITQSIHPERKDLATQTKKFQINPSGAGAMLPLLPPPPPYPHPHGDRLSSTPKVLKDNRSTHKRESKAKLKQRSDFLKDKEKSLKLRIIQLEAKLLQRQKDKKDAKHDSLESLKTKLEHRTQKSYRAELVATHIRNYLVTHSKLNKKLLRTKKKLNYTYYQLNKVKAERSNISPNKQ